MGEAEGGDDMQVEELGRTLVPRAPSKPTERELEEHFATGHATFRSWCRYCVQAKAAENPHSRTPFEQEPDAVPTLSIDYGYMGEDDGKCMPILVMKSSRTKETWASTLLNKGNNAFARAQLCNALREMAERKIIV